MRSGGFGVLAIVAVFVAAAACAPAAPPPAPTQPTPAPVSVKWIWTAVSGVSAGVWTGLDAGYFKEEGVDVDLVSFPTGKLCLDALIGGKADFATAAETPKNAARPAAVDTTTQAPKADLTKSLADKYSTPNAQRRKAEAQARID